MRTLLTIVLAAALAGSLCGTADAAKPKRTKAYSKLQTYGCWGPPRVYRYGYRFRSALPYEERLLDGVPFGTQRWWDLYNESREPW